MTSQFGDFTRRSPGGLMYKVHHGSPRVRVVDLDTTEAEEQYVIRSQDVASWFAELMPSPISFLGRIELPFRYRFPGIGAKVGLMASEAEVVPFPDDLPGDPFDAHQNAPSGTYADKHLLTIRYSTRQIEGDPEDPRTFLEHTLHSEAEFLRVTPTGVKYASPGEDPSVNPITDPEKFKEEQNPLSPVIKVIPHVHHTLKWRFVLEPNWDGIFDLIGKVNNKNESSLFSGIDTRREEVLFLGVSGGQRHIWDGARDRVQPWELDFHFDQKRVNDGGRRFHWNHEWSDTAQGWQRVFRTNLENPDEPLSLYEIGNFDVLWERPQTFR